MGNWPLFIAILLSTIAISPDNVVRAEDDVIVDDLPIVDKNMGKSRQASKTDDEVVDREEEGIKLDSMNVAQLKELREKAEKFQFQAEVTKMMKLIINSLYKNKEIFLRELISNASDALDKIRIISLTDPSAISTTEEMTIRIKADKDNHCLHVIDTGVGMTKKELTDNLGTIAKSGTSDFLAKIMDDNNNNDNEINGEGATRDLIGQFGVGFYSSFLVADKVVVTSKGNADENQHIWESDASSFSIVQDPRGPTLKRGTQITLHLKEEAYDYLEADTLKMLTEMVKEPIEDEQNDEIEAADGADEKKQKEDEEGKVEEEKDEKPKTKKVEKTTWDWEWMNNMKPIWMRKPAQVEQEEYKEFYKSIAKDSDGPMAQTHFTAEGEVTFRSILYVPKKSPHDMFQDYGKKAEAIKLYVRRVFITDDFHDMMPKYLSFIKGIVDSDDLPLNVSRESLQQHKLLKVIRKKLVRKVLDMIKRLDVDEYDQFWKEFSTNIKLGVMEDSPNRTRLAKLLRFASSNDPEKLTSLEDYVKRMKEKQDAIFYMGGSNRQEVENSPFVERLLKKGYEVLYLTEPVDEYCLPSIPEFDGRKFQNVAKEGLRLDEQAGDKAKETQQGLEKKFKPLTDWLGDVALKDLVDKAVVSQRLTTSPSALISSSFGWHGNMERIMKAQAYAKANDPTQEFYASQKKTMEINPRHPFMKELLSRVQSDQHDVVALRTAKLLYETAVLRSGYSLKDQIGFADRVEVLMRESLNVNPDEQVEEEEEDVEENDRQVEKEEEHGDEMNEEHDEL